MLKGDNYEMHRTLHLKVITLGDYAVGKSAVIPGVDLRQLGRCGMPVTASEVRVPARDRRDSVVMAVWDTCGKCCGVDSGFILMFRKCVTSMTHNCNLSANMLCFI